MRTWICILVYAFVWNMLYGICRMKVVIPDRDRVIPDRERGGIESFVTERIKQRTGRQRCNIDSLVIRDRED